MEILAALGSQRQATRWSGGLADGSQPTLWGHASRGPRQGLAGGCAPSPRQGLAGGCAPSTPPPRQRHILGAGRDVWVKIRASEVERAAWHAKARSAGLTLSDLVRRSVGRGSCVLAGT